MGIAWSIGFPVFAACFAASAIGQVKTKSELIRVAEAVDPSSAGIGRKAANLKFKTLDGTAHSLQGMVSGQSGLVIVITSADCPISRRYAPRAAALECSYDGKISFLFVNVVDAETPDDMRRAIKSFGLRSPYAADTDFRFRKALRPTTTTETLLFDKKLSLIYRGALDDQFRIGGAAAEPKRHYLRDAIDSLLAGKVPAIAATRAPGCLVDIPAEDIAPPDNRKPIQYFPRVAAVVEKNCLACHHRGGPAPFTIETPDAVRGRASMIAAVVRDGLMPPTHRRLAAPDSLVRDRSMADEDKQLLIDWLHSSRETGAPIRPTRASSPNTWRIGPPDLIVTTTGITLPADGPMQHARQLLPVNLREDRWIDSIECRPVMPDSIDAALVWIIQPGGTLPSSSIMPPAADLLTSYSPGDGVRTWGPDAARRIVAGTLLVIDSYARPMGRATTSQLRIALKYRTNPPARELRGIILSPPSLDIAAGDPIGHAEASMIVEHDMKLISLQPFMRGRGRKLVVEALSPQHVESHTLLRLDRYDWRWQIRYPLREPLVLKKGTRISVKGQYDNSEANPANPNASAPARSGPGATDEALVLSLETLH